MYQNRYPGYLLGAIAALFFYMALLNHNRSDAWILFLGAGLVTAFLTWIWERGYRRAERRRRLQREWGQKVERKREMALVREHYDREEAVENVFCVDDRTWQDLGMDDLFQILDRTRSFCGQQVLYTMLRQLQLEELPLKERGRLIEELIEEEEVREQLGEVLDQIGMTPGESCVKLLWEELPVQPAVYAWAFTPLALGALVALASPFFIGGAGIGLIVLMFFVNMTIHYREQRRITGYFTSLQHVSRLLNNSEKIARLDILPSESQELMQNSIKTLKPFRRAVSNVGIESVDPMTGSMLQYVSILFLSEVRGFFKAARIIQQKRDSFQFLFNTVGYLDACLATASYRVGQEWMTRPSFTKKKELICTQMYHPLVQAPVPNPVHLGEKGVLITGSNMSGKTTYLRGLGINVLMAQTLYTCHCREYRGSFFRLISSIDRSDNLKGKESYYLVEAKSVLRIISELGNGPYTLSLFDEIFRGTNSEERIAAAHRVLEYVAEAGGLAVAATHDLELTHLLDRTFSNYHFSETVGSGGLEFDYLLKTGPATTRNALSLLAYLGYPRSMIDRARQDVTAKAERIEETGEMR